MRRALAALTVVLVFVSLTAVGQSTGDYLDDLFAAQDSLARGIDKACQNRPDHPRCAASTTTTAAPTTTQIATTTTTLAPTTSTTAVPTTTTTLPPTTTTTAPPSGCSGVQVAAGSNLVTVANAHGAGTTFCLAAGTYNVTQTIPAQTGDKWVGALGANNARLSVLTGGDVTEIAIGHDGLGAITLRNLIVERFNTRNQGGYAAIKTTRGWTIDNIEVRLNAFTGIYLEADATVTNSYFHHNGKVGVGCFRCHNLLFENNEVSFNNTKLWNQADEGGTKIVGASNVVFRNNYFHDNFDTGIWFDSENVNALIEGNRSINNTNQGIHFEISCSGIIRNNIVEGNAEAGIFVNASQNVEVYGNTVRDNGDGIRVWAQDRGTGANCRWITDNVDIHDNFVVMDEGFTGLQRCCGWPATVFTDGSVQFTNNDYDVPTPAGQWFVWNDGPRTWSQWQGFGQDLTGSIS